MKWLVFALVAVTCLLPYIVGAPVAYVLILGFLMLCLWSPFCGRRIEAGIAALGLGAAFLILLVVNSLGGDPLITANFLMLALLAPAITGVRGAAAVSNSLRLARLALAGVAIAALVALAQVTWGGEPRATGIGTDALWSATAALAIGWTAVIGATRSAGIERYVYCLGPVLGVLVVLLAGARGPLLAVPLLLICALISAPRLWREFTGIGAASGALYVFWPARDRFDSVLQITSDMGAGGAFRDYSAAVRKQLLDASLRAIQDSPWIGHGWSNLRAAARWESAVPAFHFHSDPLDFAVAGGAVGILAYLLIIAAPVIGAWRSVRDSQYEARRLGVTLLSTTYLGCGVTNALFGFEFHTTLYVCLVVILLAFCRDTPGAAK